jgi:MoaA/NifB/PqqE/SkfB family radical SAM enzyme
MCESFLHVGDSRIENPLTGKVLSPSHRAWTTLLALVSGELKPDDLSSELHELLAADGWLVRRPQTLGLAYNLEYVSLEAHTVCNQGCFFCPVSVARRDDHFMPTEMFNRIVGELQPYRETIKALYLMVYNEPTVDKRFVDQCRTVLDAGLPPAVNTNGSGLTPARVDALMEAGQLRYLQIQLSTLDREQYRKDRGADHLEQVLRNVDYAKDRPVAQDMVICVLGAGDDEHDRCVDDITRRFEGSRFKIERYTVMDRAGKLDSGQRPDHSHLRLAGCENLGSRPLQHLHINPRGQCIFCCQDYDNEYVVGDLTKDSIEDVLTSPRMAQLRRWAYGLEESPHDFMCRKCVFALTRPS